MNSTPGHTLKLQVTVGLFGTHLLYCHTENEQPQMKCDEHKGMSY